MTVTEVDGRRLRRAQNREAVLDALVQLFEEGDYTPGTNKIAERAGISPRSLFRYFDDVDDLHRAAVERAQAMALPALEVDVAADAPLPARIQRFVDARVRLHELVGHAERAARVAAHRHPLIAAQLREGRAWFRHQARTVFAPEVHDRPELLAAVDVLCSIESYDLFRNAHGFSRAKTTNAMTAALTALLSPTGGHE